MTIERALEILLLIVVIVVIIIVGLALADRIDNDPGLLSLRQLIGA